MSKKNQIIFNDNKDLFRDVMDDYHISMMYAKDDVVAMTLDKMIPYLNKTYEKLSEQESLIHIVLDNDFGETVPEIAILTSELLSCVYADTDLDDPQPIRLTNCKCIEAAPMNCRINDDSEIVEEKDESSNEVEKNLQHFRITFDNKMSYLILEWDECILIYDCYNSFITENTFSDSETDAILYLMSFIIAGAISGPAERKDEKPCAIIDIAEYRKRKSVK